MRTCLYELAFERFQEGDNIFGKPNLFSAMPDLLSQLAKDPQCLRIEGTEHPVKQLSNPSVLETRTCPDYLPIDLGCQITYCVFLNGGNGPNPNQNKTCQTCCGSQAGWSGPRTITKPLFDGLAHKLLDKTSEACREFLTCSERKPAVNVKR